MASIVRPGLTREQRLHSNHRVTQKKLYCSAFAGGGTAGGKVVGQSDSIAGEVRDTPVSPKDLLATAFHLLGVDPHTTIPDRLNRPVSVAGKESPVRILVVMNCAERRRSP
jgi:hypothetical protein